MSFAHLPSTGSQTLRAAALLAAEATVTLDMRGLTRAPAVVIVLKSAGRTAGSVVATVQGGVTSATATFPLGSDLTRTVTTGTYTFIFLTGTIPPFVKVTLTPGGGYDGTLTVSGRACTYDPVTLLAA